jgi:hypothetical protein
MNNDDFTGEWSRKVEGIEDSRLRELHKNLDLLLLEPGEYVYGCSGETDFLALYTVNKVGVLINGEISTDKYLCLTISVEEGEESQELIRNIDHFCDLAEDY